MTLMDAVLFAPIAALISLGPGPNNFCALNNGINYGFRAALLATFGRLAAFAIFLFIGWEAIFREGGIPFSVRRR